CQQYDGDPFTF
nr:immunoglobulin light chain junction region [Macaca mulatta]MOX27743.1 immunoglobulin light chain junction region [Macaca mulatta]